MPAERRAALLALPHRASTAAPHPAALAALPLPPAPMPVVLGGRPLKRWRYVGAFGAELALCAAVVRVGPLRQAFWAVWDREAGVLHGRTRLRADGFRLDEPGRLVVTDGDDAIDLELDEGPGVVAITRHGRQHAWTAKQGGVPARGEVRVGGRTRAFAAPAIVDDTAAYYARRTAWRWSAGVGEDEAGRAVAWNLVAGVGDPPSRSERTVWLDGVPREAAPATFDEDLARVRTTDGGDLRFAAEATRQRRERLLLLSSSYRQPFGAFSGVLPGGLPLRRGFGVMEDHVARW